MIDKNGFLDADVVLDDKIGDRDNQWTDWMAADSNWGLLMSLRWMRKLL
jgi:hypothetical protein